MIGSVGCNGKSGEHSIADGGASEEDDAAAVEDHLLIGIDARRMMDAPPRQEGAEDGFQLLCIAVGLLDADDVSTQGEGLNPTKLSRAYG